MLPDEPVDEERQEELIEDNETPFQAADDVKDRSLDDTHPATDAEVQPEELYEAGLSEATGIEEPNQGNAVLGYNPEEDNRKEN